MEWIKLTTALFNDEKIQLIRNDKNGDALVCIWIQLLCIAGRQDNDGVFMLTDSKPYSEAQLAVITGRSAAEMDRAIKAFESLGMICIDNGCVTIPNWGKYQTDSLTRDAYKKSNSERQKRYRDRQKSITRNVTDNVTDNVADRNALRYVTHTEEEKEEEKEYISSYDNDSNDRNVENNVAQRILNIWPNLPQTAIETFVSYASELPDDVIGYALDETQMKPGAGFKYFKAILDHCIEKGLTTLGAIKQAEAERKARMKVACGKKNDVEYQHHSYSMEDEASYYTNPLDLIGGR